jgi:hypothetical protein
MYWSIAAPRWVISNGYNYSVQFPSTPAVGIENASRLCYQNSANNSGRIAEIRSMDLFNQLAFLVKAHCIKFAFVAPTAW